MDRDLLSARALKKSFNRTPALRGVDLSADRGEIVAVMGPSGSGKSTLLHCVAGILEPDEGEVWFEGERIDTFSEAQRARLRRSSFGFVFQFGQLIPELSATENVALPLLLSGVSRRSAVRVAMVWLERLDIGDVGSRLPADMSGGQAQRVALARALSTGPAVIFADEPTGSLDSLAGELVMQLLVRIAAEEETTVIVVTHEPRVAAYSHREILMSDGSVASTVPQS